MFSLHDNCHVGMALLELVEKVKERHTLGHARDAADGQLEQRGLLLGAYRQQIFGLREREDTV